jgi:hypothetical protein
VQAELDILHDIVSDHKVNNKDKIRDLLRHLYEKHPPKNTAHTAGDTSDVKLKKTVMNTIMHYHTDKQVCATTTCIAWRMLCTCLH